MIVDTIVKIDTVFVEKASKYISQNEMLEQISKMHTMYDDNFSNLLIIITILGGLIGFVIPIITLIFQNNQYNKFDKKIRRELKNDLKNELNTDFEDLIKKLNKYTDSKVKISNLTNGASEDIRKSIYRDALFKYIIAVNTILEGQVFNELNDIIYNLEHYSESFKKVDKRALTIYKNTFVSLLYSNIDSTIESNPDKYVMLSQIKKVLEDIFKEAENDNE